MKNLFLCGVLIYLSSCAPKILVQEAYYLEDSSEFNSDNRVDIQSYYGGDALDYITFQIDVDNRSSDTISLNQKEIQLLIKDANTPYENLYPIPKDEFIRDLAIQSDELRKEKRASTTANIIFSSLEIIGGIAAGVPATESIIYGTATAADIIDIRRGYEFAEMSIEELIAYHEEYTLDYAVLAPGKSGSYDLHFPRLMLNNDCRFEVYCQDNLYSFEYELRVVETKVR